jgi:hypothetical protein
MITMEFDELKKVWDSQNNEPLYGFNEKALHNRIVSKKNQAYHITNISELLGIIAYFTAGFFVLAVNIAKPGANVFMYFLSAWMLGGALYVLISRVRRIKRDRQFDRSMRGDLQHAILVATYQVRLSRLMRWNVLPIGIITLLGVWETGKSIWLAVGILLFAVVANYAAGWEHGIYKRKKRELEVLQSKLENEEVSDRPS